jgi:hypothetical protein
MIKSEDETGGAHSMHGENMYTGFWWGNLKEGDWLEGASTAGRVMLEWILNK